MNNIGVHRPNERLAPSSSVSLGICGYSQNIGFEKLMVVYENDVESNRKMAIAPAL